MKKRILVMILSACMLAAVAPSSVFAAEMDTEVSANETTSVETAPKEEPATGKIESDEVSGNDGMDAYIPKNAQAERDETEEAAKAMAEEIQKIQDKYGDRPGLLGFITWMQQQDELTEDQQYDLASAAMLLCMMSEITYDDFEEMTGYDGGYSAPKGRTHLVEFNDENDAITVPNIKKSIQIMKDINAKKTTDDNYPGLHADVTDFTSFAVAAVNANKGAAFTNHIYTFGYAENLAFGYSNPVDGWYDEEKALYNSVRDELGLKAGSLTGEDNQTIEERCYQEEKAVGHYTNIIGFHTSTSTSYNADTGTSTTTTTIKPTDKVAGAGYTGEGAYRNTSSYNTYEAEGGSGFYTISEFENLFNRYLSDIQYNKFKDVTHFTNSYYSAVYWAARKGITTGYSNGTFGVSKNCSRGAFVTFLWRQQGSPEPTLTAAQSGLKDFNSIGKSYQKAVLWAVEKGITTGYKDNTFRASANVTRGAAVTFLWRAAGKPKVSIARKNVSFSDMVPAGSSYETGILWAVENKITTGYSNNTFRSGSNCTRGATVTFLQRFDNLK